MDSYTSKIVNEIHQNSLRIAATGRTDIEYSWYDKKTKQISPLKNGICCDVLKTIPAEFCLENTYTIVDILQRALPDCLVDLDFHDVLHDDGEVVKPAEHVPEKVAKNMLQADLRALNGGGGLLERMAQLQHEKRLKVAQKYQASISKGPYPYIVIDWSEDADEDN
jgi:hypothetical protein